MIGQMKGFGEWLVAENEQGSKGEWIGMGNDGVKAKVRTVEGRVGWDGRRMMKNGCSRVSDGLLKKR